MLRKPSTQCGMWAYLSSSNNYEKGIPMCVWHLLWNWYNKSLCSVTWNHAISTSFLIHQGVRQGAILSPLLYSIFVDELLGILTTSGFGVTIYCGAPMYANDLALITDSPEPQATLHRAHLCRKVEIQPQCKQHLECSIGMVNCT